MLRHSEIKRLSQDLPGYTFLHSYAAALPFYECDLEVRVMVRHELSALQQYSLACIAKGVDSVDAVDVILGAGRLAVTRAMASLLGAELIRPRDAGAPAGESRFVLSEKGVDALNELGWRRPQTALVRVLYDGLKGDLVAPNRLMYINSGESAKYGLHVIPSRCAAPTLGDIGHVAVRRVIREVKRSDARRFPDGELHDLIGVAGKRPVYRRCEVAAFQGPDGAVVFRVLDRGKRLPEYEDQLTAMSPAQPEVLPFERVEVSALPAEISPLIPRDLLEKADKLEDERDRLRAIVESEETAVPEPPMSFEGEAELSASAAAVASATSRTREELEVVRRRLEEVERERDSLRLIETHEHRELLEKALKHARKRVIIVSPWLSPAAINDELQKLMRRAIEKGVEIVIGWGIPPEEADERAGRRDEKSLYMLRQLERLAREARDAAVKRRKELEARRGKEQGGKEGADTRSTEELEPGRLRVVRLGVTHEKILIADTRFAVVTSFNFLSFRADPKRGFRRETGVYYEVKAKVEELIDNVMKRIERVEQASQPGDRDTRVTA